MSARVAVVGGGLAGLAAAYRLQRLGADPLVLEASPGFGGKVRTERVEGLVLEEGPDSFLVRKPEVIELCQELGISGELVPLPPGGSGSAIFSRGRLHPIPPGLMLGLPTEVGPILRSGLLSAGGKLRAAWDLVAPPERCSGDEPLGRLVAHRMGTQVLDRLVAPLLTGIYAGDPWSMSTEATFPQLLEIARADGSLVRGARRLRRRAPRGAPPGPMFMTLRTGLAAVVEALTAALPASALRAESAVAEIRRDERGYVLHLAGGEEIQADGVLLAVPAPVAGVLLRELAPEAALELFAVPYASLAVVQLAFHPQDVPQPLKGSGFLVDRAAGLSITACTYVVNKWPHESQGAVLLRCYLGRAGQDPLGVPDAQMLEAVRRDLRTVLGIRREPFLQRVYRWPQSMPQYMVGHLARMAGVQRRIAEHPALALAGAAYQGVGMPDVVRQGYRAALGVARDLGLAREDEEEGYLRSTQRNG